MNRTISWPDKSLAAEICCAPEVLHDLETAAVDGLLAMPRTGLGIGGMLLGKRGDRRIEILRALAIPCSHALGPAFILTSEETLAAGWRASDQRSENSSNPASELADFELASDELATYELVGCYWSKPNGSFTPTDYDHVLFEALCPELWQVALVIRPSLGGVTTAAFGFHGEGNRLVLGVPRDLIRNDAEDAQAGQETESLAPEAAPVIAPQAVEPTLPAEMLPVEIIPVAMPRSGTLFGVPEPARGREREIPERKRRWPKVLLALAILLAILAASAFLTRAWWVPQLRITLRTYLPASGISK